MEHLSRSKTFAEVWTIFEDSREQKSDTHKCTLARIGGKLTASIGNKMICDITHEQLNDALKKDFGSPHTFNLALRSASPAFNMAVTQGWAKENVCKRIEKIDTGRKKAVVKYIKLTIIAAIAGVSVLSADDYTSTRKAAEQGYAYAQFSLAIAYANGKGVQKDNVEAAKWYRKAAEQGHVVARLTLGLCYAEGDGVPKDSALAYMWINIAAAQGYHLAVSQRDIIAQRMTKEQIAEGQKLTREWMAKHSEK